MIFTALVSPPGAFAKPAAQLFMPATVVPMASEIGLVFGHYDQMEGSGGNRGIATGTYVVLAGGVGLNRRDRYPRIAHASRTTTTAIVTITRAISSGDLWAGFCYVGA